MPGTKEYKIVINGITESVNAVDSLLKKLDTLEQRIDAISQKQATVSTANGGSGGGSSTRKSDLTEEAKLVDQITRLQEKRNALETEWGKQLMDEKQAMKELNAEQKSLAAKDRLAAGGYDSNTMLGMKSELADIKAAMQTMEVGSQEMEQAAQRANELNNKLKEIEQSYGQYGRNVGNYANSIMEAMNGITIKVGEQEVKFNSTKEALRTFRENIKQMTVEGKQNTEEYDNQIKALHELEMALQEADSAINDVKMSSKGMDEAMDWMQSFGAMGQISQGFSAFFGNTGFEESIQKLMSLQNVLQGLETIQKQLNTGEGLGKWLGSVNGGIDKMVSKMTGATKTMEGWTASTKAATIAARTFSTVLKGIATLGIGIVLEKAVELFEKLGNAIKGADNSANEAVNSINLVTGELEAQNLELENNIKLIDLKLAKGEISEEEAKKQKIEETNKVLRDQLDTLIEISRLNRSDDVYKQVNAGINSLGTENSLINAENLKKTQELWNTYHNAVIHDLNVFEEKAEESGQTLGNWLSQVSASLGIIRGDAEDTEEDFNRMTQNIIGQFIAMGQQIVSHTGEFTAQQKSYIQDLINAMDDKAFLGTILLNLDKYLGDAAANFKPIIMSMMSQIRSIGGSIGLTGTESEEDRKKRLDKELADIKKHNTARVKAAKSTAKSTLDIEKETQQMRIQMMSEGILKTIAQLNKERDEKLKKFRQNKQMELEINRYYDKKIAEERKKWQDKMLEEERQIWARVFSYNRETMEIESNAFMDEFERTVEKIKNSSSVSLYDIFLTETTGSKSDELAETFKNMRQLIDKREERSAKGQWSDINEEEYQRVYNEMKKIYDLSKQFEGLDFDKFLKFYDTTFFGDSLETFTDNIGQIEEKWQEILTQNYYSFEEYYKQRRDLLDREISLEREAVTDWQTEEEKKTKAHYKELMDNVKNDDERVKYERKQEEALARIRQEATDRDAALTVKHTNEELKLEEERKKKEIDIYNEMYSEILNEYDNFKRQIDDIANQQPKRNAWGFINVKESNRINRIVLEDLKILREEMLKTQDSLKNLYEQGQIDKATFDRLMNDLINQFEGLNDKIKETGQALSWEGKIQDFFQNLQQYYSAISDSFQTILSEFQANQDYMIERQMDALDKENEELQKKLEENEKILERHKNNVDKIEGELADARGDRRERLIDALNQEIIAQRRAQAEKEKLEKEQEKIEERQRELEKKQRENEYKRGLQQILFQTSQAVMYAAANSWPLPAIPLMALAAATGTMQYSLAKQRKPYAEGGIIEGLSHSNGGVPVGNTGIEVEGGEFITSKRQTEANRDILEAINNGNGRLTIEDLQNVGINLNVSPLQPNGVSSSTMTEAFVAYANRPIVVSVVDIVNKQNEVRTVQTLAGMP